MREPDIEQFLRLMGVRHSDVTSARGFVNAPCPLAPWRHQSGKDSHPSFGVSINDSGKSIFCCFGCHADAVGVSWLIQYLWLYTNKYPHDLAKFYADHEIFSENIPDDDEHAFTVDKWKPEDSPFKEIVPIPVRVLSKYPLLQGASDSASSAVLAYLTMDRNIDKTVAHFAGVRYGTDNLGTFVVYPATDKSGKICLLRARSIYRKDNWTINPTVAGFPDLEFPSLRDSGALFGLCDVDWAKPLMLVEGGEDRLRLMTLGYWNVVASLTTNFTQTQLGNLTSAPAIIVGYDEDKAGSRSFAKVLKELRGKIPIFRVFWSRAGMNSKGLPCKDGGDLQDREQLLKVLESMEEFV